MSHVSYSTYLVQLNKVSNFMPLPYLLHLSREYQRHEHYRASQLLFSILFADDTSVFLIGKEYTQLIISLNEELKKMSRWLNANGLTINLKKTHYMVFHRARIKAKDLNVEMQGNNIDCVTTTKYLGVIIDNKLKWTSHILYIKNKISKTIGLFYKMRQYLERKSLINLYYSLFFPYLIYCNEVWGNAFRREPSEQLHSLAIYHLLNPFFNL